MSHQKVIHVASWQNRCHRAESNMRLRVYLGIGMSSCQLAEIKNLHYHFPNFSDSIIPSGNSI